MYVCMYVYPVILVFCDHGIKPLPMAMAMATTSLCPSSSSSSFFSQFSSNLREEFCVDELRRRRNANRVVGKAIRSAIIHKDEGELRASFDANTLDVPVHTVTVHDRTTGSVHKVQVPEDQYILHTAEYQDINLPFSCRHGCCTACAVRVKSGEIYQPRALGISPELKEQGYALLCVGYPLSDLEVETQDEDEVYWLQFGQYFAGGPVERDDYALELAVADE